MNLTLLDSSPTNAIKAALSAASLALAAVQASTNSRTFTVTNNCPFTIWWAYDLTAPKYLVSLTIMNRPAVFTDLNVASNVPNQPTGWEAPAGSSISFSVPDDWKAGRIWVGYFVHRGLIDLYWRCLIDRQDVIATFLLIPPVPWLALRVDVMVACSVIHTLELASLLLLLLSSLFKVMVIS